VIQIPLQWTAILFDCETTGLDESDIIETAYFPLEECCLRHGDLNDVARFRPTKPITLGAMAVHHIIPEDFDALNLPPSSEAKLPPHIKYIVGHNIDFDWKALGCPPVRRICTLALARAIWPNLDSHTNGALYYYFSTDRRFARVVLRNAHSALADIGVTHLILEKIVARLKPRSLDHLWEMSEKARIPTIMTFGKHKGKPVSAVDGGYKGWYSRQEDPDPYLLKAFRGEPGLVVPAEVV